MIDAIGLLSSAAGGGIVGLIGAGLKAVERIVEQRREQDHALAMRRLDIEELAAERAAAAELARMETQARVAIAETEASAQRELARSATVSASYTHDAETGGRAAGWVDSVRGMMRSVVTIYLLAILSLIAWQLHSAGATPSADLYGEVIRTFIFLAVTAVTWWFGAQRPGGQK